LINLTGSPDPALTLSESLVEDCVSWLDQALGRVCKKGEGIFIRNTRPLRLLTLITNISAVLSRYAEETLQDHR
jgi:hypothetical protein